MPDELEPGLYESLLTDALRATLERAQAAGWIVESTPIDDTAIASIVQRDCYCRGPYATLARRSRHMEDPKPESIKKMLRELVSRFSSTIAERRASVRKKLHVPVKVCFAPKRLFDKKPSKPSQ